MKGFGSVFVQEWVLLKHNTTWWAILGLLLVLTVLAALNGAARTDQRAEMGAGLNQGELQTQTALQSAVARWEANPEGDPPSVASPGALGLSVLSHYTVLPPTPLAALSIGQTDVQPTYYKVTAHPALTFLNETEIQNPLNVLAGSFDVAFVIVFLLPIFIVALTFDLMSKEKESGVLGLVLAHGVSKTAFIIAKGAARAVLIFLLLLLVGVAAVLLTEPDLSNGAMWGRFGLWFLVVSLYAFFWFALALFVNSLNKPSVTNGVILANLWLVFVVVIPALVNVAATTIFPAPSRVELTTEMREATEIADQESAESREAFFFDHPEMVGGDANADQFFLQVLATDSAVERAVEPLMAEFDIQARKRQEVVDFLQYVSPAIMTQNALNAVSGTGTERFTDFVVQVLTFHENWRGFFTSRVIKGARMSSAEFDEIPTYSHKDIGTETILRATLSPAAGLAIFVLILGGWSARRYSEYPAV
jgi:ABC-2 type transport system permease protein